MPLLEMSSVLPLPLFALDSLGAREEEAGPVLLSHQASAVGTLACGCAPSTGRIGQLHPSRMALPCAVHDAGRPHL